MKNPKSAVWVVCSESHYSILFSFDSNASSSSAALGGGMQHVHYYDPLGKQEDVYKISVDPNSIEPVPDEKHVMVSPIDHCIRTRWRGSALNWNGADPVF